MKKGDREEEDKETDCGTVGLALACVLGLTMSKTVYAPTPSHCLPMCVHIVQPFHPLSHFLSLSLLLL